MRANGKAERGERAERGRIGTAGTGRKLRGRNRAQSAQGGTGRKLRKRRRTGQEHAAEQRKSHSGSTEKGGRAAEHCQQQHVPLSVKGPLLAVQSIK